MNQVCVSHHELLEGNAYARQLQSRVGKQIIWVRSDFDAGSAEVRATFGALRCENTFVIGLTSLKIQEKTSKMEMK
jgi:hypothetical protein